jgi:flavodoxin
MKVQSYYSSKAGNSYMIAAAIAKENSVKVDQIPPAYQPENERVVFISFESNYADEKLEKFLKTLTTAKCKSVAFAVVGPDTKGLDNYKKIVSDLGIKVHDDVYECKVTSGLFKKGKVTEEQVKGALAWSEKIKEAMAS